ncbi:unnamed protein product, partial [Aureobasidium mustum]
IEEKAVGATKTVAAVSKASMAVDGARVSTCVPTTGNLLSPINHPICPLASERYELRTAALGCKCSTYTLLSIIITVFCTIGVLVLVSLVLWLLKWWGRTMRSGGWEIVVEEDGRVRQGTWRRGSLWPRWMVARR